MTTPVTPYKPHPATAVMAVIPEDDNERNIISWPSLIRCSDRV